MNETTDVEFRAMGVCVKSLDGVVLTQNQKCIDICGVQSGNKCAFGCGLHIGKNDSDDLGFNTFRTAINPGLRVNVVLINDGVHITSLLCDIKDVVKEQMAQVEAYALSRAESRVLEAYLYGYSNVETAERLYISRATLRTHLNNIYKKIPLKMKERILASHMRLSSS